MSSVSRISSVVQIQPVVQAIRVVRDPEPTLPPIREDERDQVDTYTPSECPDPRAALPLAQWFECQINEHRRRGEGTADDQLHELICTALQDIVLSFKQTKARTVAELIERDPRLRGVRLDLVAIPEHRVMGLAATLDEEASYYLDLGAELGRLAAWAILYHAEGIEYHGACTVQEYYDAEDDEIAALNSFEDFAYASLDNPLW